MVLGVALRPFALGHALLLARLGSPFMRASELRAGELRVESRGGAASAAQLSTFKSQPPRLPSLGDLLLALEVCRHEPFRVPGRRWLSWLGWLKRNTAEGDLLDACIAFASYVNEAHQLPPHSSRGGGGDGGIPWLQALKITLMVKLHKSEAEALRTPLQLAILDCFAVWAGEGAVEVGDRKAAMLKMLAQAEAQAAAGRGASPAQLSTLNPQLD